MKNKLTKILLSFITVGALTITSITSTTTARAIYAPNFGPNAVWKKSDTSDGNLNIVQQLHNGNEIYYSITTPSNNVYYKIWQIAANNWSKLGVIKLVQVPAGDSRSEITLSGTYRYVTIKTANRIMKRDYHGETATGNTDGSYFTNTVGPNQDRKYMTQTSSQLYPNLWRYNVKTTINTAEHELGHALGLEHSEKKINGKPVIMNEFVDYSNHPLGNYEKNLLLQDYGEFLNQSNNSSDSSSDQSNAVNSGSTDSNNG